MVSIQVTDVKQFMQKLLIKPVFDSFYMVKLDIHGFCSFSMEGKLNKTFYNTDEQKELSGRDYALWEEVRPHALAMVKGNKTPIYFRIVLMASDMKKESVVSQCAGGVSPVDVTGLYLNIMFENSALMLVTGTSRKTFTMDKSLDKVWDDELKIFLRENEIT